MNKLILVGNMAGIQLQAQHEKSLRNYNTKSYMYGSAMNVYACRTLSNSLLYKSLREVYFRC